MVIRGRALVVGDDVDTDAIVPARYLVTSDPAELGRHCLEGLDLGFPGRIRPGDILVAGENFGCGSSREHAVLALKGAGIGCVVARSFARIFFRNATNLGFPLVECPVLRDVAEGDLLAVDLRRGVIRDLTSGRAFAAPPLPPFILEILDAGGLIPWARRRRYGA
ncbi:TPA: 3-isopropylmalate dehydratase small subunit [Candidatus Bipolaricaulota bacterium]|nr:3-isopropylmalate dehydratase small subunit [Candidatus Bipolaricaulota bacterium]